MAPKTLSTSKTRSSTFVLGAAHFDKISAVEGLAPTRGMLKDFQSMDQRGLSADERVLFLKAKYGQNSCLTCFISR